MATSAQMKSLLNSHFIGDDLLTEVETKIANVIKTEIMV